MKTENHHPSAIRIGIDIGGTFTDFVIFNPTTAEISTFKLPSTPKDPSEAVNTGINRISKALSKNEDQLIQSDNQRSIAVIHGSTVATNALLERKGATTALITTKGFKDVIQIGRQNRPDLYDFATDLPKPLVPSELRFELTERVDQNGNTIEKLNYDDVNKLVSHLQSIEPELQSIAVCFLFSFANPNHEQLVAEKLRNAGFFVSASHEILPEYREYERTSTTVVNAYVSPVLDRYLKKLDSNVNYIIDNKAPATISNLQIMQSNGGSISLTEARKSGVRCILSGPAGGVVGCQYIGSLALNNAEISGLRLLTFDMGGTSTDVSLIDGHPNVTSEAEVGGLPIRIPVLDIHTIGAGGGSIAMIDAGGALRVGPESAGADPGPACYGRKINHREPNSKKELSSSAHSPLATVTDANLLLGRIPADRFLGGEMLLYPDLAEAAIAPLATQLGLSTTETALGIIEIANAHMERALRVISVERGHDPRQFTLLSFGGAGSLHAADLARRLRIPRVLIPPYAATLSAFGMLAADVVKDYTQTVMLSGNTPFENIESKINIMLERAYHEIKNEGFSDGKIRLEPALDMRYRGQSYELLVPLTKDFVKDFHERHHQTYGYLRPEADLEIVNLRVRGIGQVDSPKITAQPLMDADPAGALMDYRQIVMEGNVKTEVPFYHGETLDHGNKVTGPAVVLRNDTTILIGQSDRAHVDAFNNLIIEIGS
jgi:N-methylhydantoinase A